MIKYFFITIMLCATNFAYSQNAIYQFEVLNTNGKQYLKSCIDIDLYKDEFSYPVRKNGEYIKKKKKSVENKFTILDIYWEEQCLMIPVNTHEKSELVKLINFITYVDEKQIMITVAKN